MIIFLMCNIFSFSIKKITQVETKFGSYLLPEKFFILTLEEAFLAILQHMVGSSRHARWLLRLQGFEYTNQVERSHLASLAGLLARFHFKKNLENNKTTPPPPIEVKLESSHFLFYEGAYYQRVIEKVATSMEEYNPIGNKVYFCKGNFWNPCTPTMRQNAKPCFQDQSGI